jgi:hypothetical protein
MRATSACVLVLAIGLGGPPQLLARTFIDSKGRELEAELISVESEEATIRRADGAEFTLPFSKFSPADQKFIRDWETERLEKLAEKSPKPGETLTFEFPDLPKDFKGKPASFNVRIPAGYSPDKPAPLLIFLPGGTGGNDPGGAVGLTKGDFVCAGLPYPDDGRNPAQNNMVGDFDKVWDYWQPMLKKLETAIPNLDPDLRVIGGFSNGGHAIDGVLSESDFGEFFTAFFLVDGGGGLPSRYREVRDKHCYVAWGEKSPNAANSEEVVSRAKRAGMVVVESPMAEVGHAFPGSEKEKVTSWLYETVIPAAREASAE